MPSGQVRHCTDTTSPAINLIPTTKSPDLALLRAVVILAPTSAQRNTRCSTNGPRAVVSPLVKCPSAKLNYSTAWGILKKGGRLANETTCRAAHTMLQSAAAADGGYARTITIRPPQHGNHVKARASITRAAAVGPSAHPTCSHSTASKLRRPRAHSVPLPGAQSPLPGRSPGAVARARARLARLGRLQGVHPVRSGQRVQCNLNDHPKGDGANSALNPFPQSYRLAQLTSRAAAPSPCGAKC